MKQLLIFIVVSFNGVLISSDGWHSMDTPEYFPPNNLSPIAPAATASSVVFHTPTTATSAAAGSNSQANSQSSARPPSHPKSRLNTKLALKLELLEIRLRNLEKQCAAEDSIQRLTDMLNTQCDTTKKWREHSEKKMCDLSKKQEETQNSITRLFSAFALITNQLETLTQQLDEIRKQQKRILESAPISPSWSPYLSPQAPPRCASVGLVVPDFKLANETAADLTFNLRAKPQTRLEHYQKSHSYLTLPAQPARKKTSRRTAHEHARSLTPPVFHKPVKPKSGTHSPMPQSRSH